jgi:hypothetical protein
MNLSSQLWVLVVEIGGSKSRLAGRRGREYKTLSQKLPKAKMTEGMTQMIEHLAKQHKALKSSPSATKLGKIIFDHETKIS